MMRGGAADAPLTNASTVTNANNTALSVRFISNLRRNAGQRVVSEHVALDVERQQRSIHDTRCLRVELSTAHRLYGRDVDARPEPADRGEHVVDRMHLQRGKQIGVVAAVRV